MKIGAPGALSLYPGFQRAGCSVRSAAGYLRGSWPAVKKHGKCQLLPREQIGSMGKRSSSDAGNYGGLFSSSPPTELSNSFQLALLWESHTALQLPRCPFSTPANDALALMVFENISSQLYSFQVDCFYFSGGEPPAGLSACQPFPHGTLGSKKRHCLL